MAGMRKLWYCIQIVYYTARTHHNLIIGISHTISSVMVIYTGLTRAERLVMQDKMRRESDGK